MIFFIFITSYFKIGNSNTFNRIFEKTYNQITKIEINTNKSDTKIKKELKNFNIYSKDHEGHILLALYLFEKNKIFGIGPKGFRNWDLLHTSTQYINSNSFRTWSDWFSFLYCCSNICFI